MNGGKSKQFKPIRTLRQGDPLSSYLFIFGQEVLSRMLEHEYSSNSISGIKASSGGPAITHVMYADDIFLFSKANRLEAARIMACVDKYCKWSGQMIIRGKSGVFFFFLKEHPNPNSQMSQEYAPYEGSEERRCVSRSPLR